MKQVHQKLLSVTSVSLQHRLCRTASADDSLQLSIFQRGLRLSAQYPRILHRPWSLNIRQSLAPFQSLFSKRSTSRVHRSPLGKTPTEDLQSRHRPCISSQLTAPEPDAPERHRGRPTRNRAREVCPCGGKGRRSPSWTRPSNPVTFPGWMDHDVEHELDVRHEGETGGGE